MKIILFILIIFINNFENMAAGEDGGEPSQRKDKRPLEIIDLDSDSSNMDREENNGINQAAIRPADAHFNSLINTHGGEFGQYQRGIKIGGEDGQQANPSKKLKSSKPETIQVTPVNFRDVVQKLTDGTSADVKDINLGHSGIQLPPQLYPIPLEPEDKFIVHQSHPIQYNPQVGASMMTKNIGQSQQKHSSSAANKLINTSKEIKIHGKGGQTNPSKKLEFSEPKIIYYDSPKHFDVEPGNFKTVVQKLTGKNAPVNDNQEITVHHPNPLQNFNPQPQQATSIHQEKLQNQQQYFGHGIGQGSSSSVGIQGHHQQIHVQAQFSRFAPAGLNQQMSATNHPNEREIEINEAIEEIDQKLDKLIVEDHNLELKLDRINHDLHVYDIKLIKLSDEEVQQLKAQRNQLKEHKMLLVKQIAELQYQKEQFQKQLRENKMQQQWPSKSIKKPKYTEPKIIYIDDDKPIIVDPANFKEFVQQKTGMNAPINNQQIVQHHQNPLQIFKPQPQIQSTSINHYYRQQLEQKLGLREQISPRIGQGSSSSAFGVVGHQIHGQWRFAPGPGQNQQMSAANRPNDTENVNESRRQQINGLIDKRREAKELKRVFENINKKIGTLQDKGMEQNTQEIEMLRASKKEIVKLMDNLNVEITTLENESKRRN